MRTRSLQLLFIALLSITVPTLEASAQSGRKKTEPPTPVPIATPPPSREIEQVPAKITTLVVGGEVTNNSIYFHSNDLDLFIKEFIFWMKYEPRPFLGATKVGKMKFEAAKEAAKKETDRHLLWLSVRLKNDSYRGMFAEYVDYAILLPQTGRSLLTGQLIPGEEKIYAQGGVMKIPTVPKRTSVIVQLKMAARELAFKLKATSWF